jgi:hypothetical protein
MARYHSLDSFALKLLGGLNTFVGRGNLTVSLMFPAHTYVAYLDQDSLLVDAEVLIELNEVMGFGDGAGWVLSIDSITGSS